MVNIFTIKPKTTLSKRVDSKATTIKKRTHLFLHDKFITDLGNISTSENLSVLYLYNNNISKIENLDAAVNLRSLYLQNNKILKIENLQCLKNLQKLYLAHNEISVVEGLETLNNLEELHIEKQRLNGDSLCFDPRTIINIADKLLLLNISHNNITNIANLTPLKNIKILNASHNKLSDVGQVCDTLRSWYHLCDATFIGNTIAKQHRYRENLIANTFRMSILDNKEVSETTRCFIKRFEQEKLNQTSKHSINLADKIPSLPKNYPMSVQKAVSNSILKNRKPCFDDSTLGCDVDDIYMPWNAMPKSSSNIAKKFPALLKIQKKQNANRMRFTTTFPFFSD